MSSRDYDAVIVGQGLAGTCLAWRLIEAGLRVLVVGRDDTCTASRVAAGLITPVTGPRLTIAWKWETAWPIAAEFYRRVEQQTRETFFFPTKSVRLLRNESEQTWLDRRRPQLRKLGLISDAVPQLNASCFVTCPAFEMHSARLDTATFLDASREWFLAQHCYRTRDIDWKRDIRPHDRGIGVASLGVQARWIFFCLGYQPDPPEWFTSLRLNPAKGEILRVQSGVLRESRSIHHDVWLAPAGVAAEFLLGATFEWQQLDSRPTSAGREELLSKSRRVVRTPLRVVDHVAAVRPTSHDFRPTIGMHPQLPRLGIMNGLGTRGALLAPWLAARFVGSLTRNESIDEEIGVARWFR